MMNGKTIKTRGLKGVLHILLLTAVMSLIVFSNATARAQSTIPELKAAFLFNFLDFMQWPDGHFDRSGGNARICVIGNPQLADSLQYIAKRKKARGIYSLQVIRANQLAEIRSIGICHVVYLDDNRSREIKQLIRAALGKSILTVSDRQYFATSGGAIEFIRKGKKLGLRINRSVVQRAQLSINPHLLALADVVSDSSE